MELRVNFNFLISEWQPGRDGSRANNGGSVLCSHPTSEVGQHPGPAGKQAGMVLPGIPLGIPLLPKDTFLFFLREWFGARSALVEIAAKNDFGGSFF